MNEQFGAAQLATLKAEHEACRAQRESDRALLHQVAEDIAEIKQALGRIPWRVLTGNGVPPIDIRMDRVERIASMLTWVVSTTLAAVLVGVVGVAITFVARR